VRELATRGAVDSIATRVKKKPGWTPGLAVAVAIYRVQSNHDFN
jgi:hypothetical protein